MKKIALNVFLVLFSLVVVAALGELTLRALQKLEVLEPYTVQKLFPKKKNQNNFSAKLVPSDNPTLFMQHDVNDKRINSYGFRGQEIKLEKPKNVFRILAIGDSVTYGLGVVNHKTFSSDLQRKLNKWSQENKKGHVEVVNLGVSGYNTSAELEILKTKGLPLKPDYVVLTYVLNDAMPVDMMVQTVAAFKKTLIFYKKLSETTQLGAMVYFKWQKILEKHRSKLVYGATYKNEENWQQVSSAIEGFKQISEQHNIPVVVQVVPLLVGFENYPFKHLHAKVRKEFEKNGFEVIDLLDEFSKYPHQKFKLADSDKTHPNLFGHQLMSEILFQYFVEKNSI